jgi:anaerobic selenocysteine-containing dehydrogenase
MGIDEKPRPELLDQLKKVFGFEPPRAHGHNVVNAVQSMIDGRAKVFFGLGGNFVRAVPDWPAAESAMRRLRLTVAVSTKLNRGHLETETGHANFMVFPGLGEDPDIVDPGMLRLATLRSHDQYNTTIYSLDDRYRGVFGGRMVVFMNEADMRARGIAEGDPVELESLADDKQRIVGGFWAKVHAIAPGSVGAYYPETNPLLPLAFHDVKSETPAAKSIPVLVRRQARSPTPDQ